MFVFIQYTKADSTQCQLQFHDSWVYVEYANCSWLKWITECYHIFFFHFPGGNCDVICMWVICNGLCDGDMLWHTIAQLIYRSSSKFYFIRFAWNHRTRSIRIQISNWIEMSEREMNIQNNGITTVVIPFIQKTQSCHIIRCYCYYESLNKNECDVYPFTR